ncbi:class I SAM-dependent methyltransferase [Streptomyces sp. NPDC059853]|uniref:class I SAM-dependent methyltransferase n=1 Tax=Streptomyces sp. NPDC059853 TaxID=3346973 RepID=UPI00365D6B49
MPFDHNDHYHRLLLRTLATGRAGRTGGRALDVGCGTGRFARRLAAAGYTVDGIDPSAEVIAEARAAAAHGEGDGDGERANPRYRQADITTTELPAGHYDVISALASIHHVPFATVARLRDALAPGGTLVILGCAPESGPVDLLRSAVAVPVNAVARVAVWARDRATGRRAPAPSPVAEPTLPLPEIRRQAAVLLPGATVRRRLFWRYLLVYRHPSTPTGPLP